jgi:subfamily B ATP-binding cassette protein MsbA
MLARITSGVRGYLEACGLFGLTQKQFLVMLLLLLSGIVFESFGVVLILPILSFVELGGDLSAVKEGSWIWGPVFKLFALFGFEVDFFSLLLVAFLSFCFSAAFTYLRAIYLDNIRFLALSRARDNYFCALMDSKLSLLNETSHGEFINEIVTELERSLSFMFNMVTTVFSGIVVFIYIVLVIYFSAPIVIILLPTLLVSLLISRYINRLSANAGKRVADSNRIFVSFFKERIGGSRLIKLSGTSGEEYEKMTGITSALSTSLFKTHELRARLILKTEVGLFVASLIRFMPRLREFLASIQSLKLFSGSLSVVLKRFEQAELFRERSSGNKRFAKLKVGIQFDDVHFSYRGADRPALKGVNFFIPANRVTAIVGPSGAGKSTLVDLIPRFIDPTTGNIKFDGSVHSGFALNELRSGISYCPQEPKLFNMPVHDYIGYGSKNKNIQTVENAAKKSGADGFISQLPAKYSQLLGENSGSMSGGQKRRIDLARCLHKPSEVLIMDEPTGNLDAITEQYFQKVLREIQSKGEQTVILIGHQLNLTRLADQIAVIEDGVVTAVGAHEDLIVKSPWYSLAFEKQINSR